MRVALHAPAVLVALHGWHTNHAMPEVACHAPLQAGGLLTSSPIATSLPPPPACPPAIFVPGKPQAAEVQAANLGLLTLATTALDHAPDDPALPARRAATLRELHTALSLAGRAHCKWGADDVEAAYRVRRGGGIRGEGGPTG